MNTRCLTAMMLVYAASFAAATADASLPERSAPSSSLYDPDAQIESALTKSQSSQSRQSNRAVILAAEQRRRAKDQENSDWLLRSYEEQLRARSTNSSKNDGTNIYYEIGSDRNLSKLAGITMFDPNNSAQTLNVHMAMANPGKDALTLRPDPLPSSAFAGQPTSEKNPAPFFKSYASTVTGFASLHNSYATPSSGMQQFFPKGETPVIKPPLPSYTRLNSDPTAIETPGMIAAENNPLLDKDASNFSLDRLPGESVSEAKAHQENLTLVEPPRVTDVSQLQKLRDTATKAPGSIKLAPPAPINPILLKFQEDPPVTAPPPSPIRTPVNDPRDMTFR